MKKLAIIISILLFCATLCYAAREQFIPDLRTKNHISTAITSNTITILDSIPSIAITELTHDTYSDLKGYYFPDSDVADQSVAATEGTIAWCNAQISTDEGVIVLTPNITYTISEDITLGDNVQMVVPPGADLAIANTKTLTFVLPPVAGNYQIFSGAGTVTYTTNHLTYDSWVDGAGDDIIPSVDDTIDLGEASYQFKDGYFDGNLFCDNLYLGGNTLYLDSDNDTNIDASTDDQIDFKVNNVDQLIITDGTFEPVTDSDIDFGSTTKYFKDGYIDTITTTGNVAIGGVLNLTGALSLAAITATGGTLTITGDSAITGDLVVTGTVTSGNERFYEINNSNATAFSSIVEMAMHTYTLSANILGTSDGVRIRAAGTIIGSHDTKVIRLYFGATNWIMINQAAADQNDWQIDATIYNVLTATQRIAWVSIESDSPNILLSGYETANVDTTGDVVVKITGILGDDRDFITQRMWSVEKLN